MPAVGQNMPHPVKVMNFHGVHFNGKVSGDQWWADCPFCLKEGKFSVNVQTTRWDCKPCQSKGNISSFLTDVHKLGVKTTKPDQYHELAESRKLLSPETLEAWGCVKSPISGAWILPGYGPNHSLTTLYKYARLVRPGGNGKFVLMSTPGMKSGVFGVNLFDPKKEVVFLCEGPWDAMALWEVLRITKREPDGGFALTSNEEVSLAAGANVLAVPGCGVFEDSWGQLLGGKVVHLMFDSDHPTGHNGDTKEPAGLAGMKKVFAVMKTRSAERVADMKYLHWGEDGYDPELPSGYDVRDLLTVGNTESDRVKSLGKLFSKFQPIPDSWSMEKIVHNGKIANTLELKPTECKEWKTLVQYWRKALSWPSPGTGLDHALAAMLACCASTSVSGGCQLWIKVIGPAACGKTTLCEAISVARNYVFPKDTITGLFSGYQVDREGAENMSLAPQLDGKTLVIKDADTILQQPNLTQILSQFRALYDRSVRTQYGNKMSKNYENLNTTVIFSGTGSMKILDTSELGERFLDCEIADRIDDDLEDVVNQSIFHKEIRNMQSMKTKASVGVMDADTVRAYQITGGYVEYLRRNIDNLISDLDVPDTVETEICNLAKFVAYMRARPSLKQQEKAEREFSGRLLTQLLRMAMCMSVVLNRTSVDESVMKRVKKIAIDTAKGRVTDICGHLYDAGEQGLESENVSMFVTGKTEEVVFLLRFMRKIEVVELFSVTVKGKKTGRKRWRLTPKIRRLWRDVMAKDDKPVVI